MRPSILYEALATDPGLVSVGIGGNRVLESQSVDSRPFDTGHFITISGDEVLFSSVGSLERGPRTFTIAVHVNSEEQRDYTTIDFILGRVALIYRGMENVSGVDGVRVSQVRGAGRSGNLLDEGWKTITRNQTFGVLYDELAA